MSAASKALFAFTNVFMRLFGKALDQTKLAGALDHEATIVEDGKYIYAQIRIGSYVSRERVPRQIHGWPPERQEAYLEEVKDRLIARFKMEKKDAPPPEDKGPGRKALRARDAAVRRAIRKRRA